MCGPQKRDLWPGVRIHTSCKDAGHASTKKQKGEFAMRQHEIEEMRNRMTEKGFYAPEDIEAICRLETEYSVECERIAQECEEEGYPSHGENWELRCGEARKYYDEQIALIDAKPCYAEKRIEGLMSSPEVEEIRERLTADAVYSAEDIDAICRLEAAYLDECQCADGGFEEISKYYEGQISAITSRYGEREGELEEAGVDR